MATYNFKKQAEVYLFHDNKRYRLDVTEDLSFSQTFTDKTYPQKTLHAQYKVHDASCIKKANPANFQFTVPMITEDSLDTIFDLLVNYKTGTYTLDTFDLYIKLPNDIYKLEKCVITNGTFIIEKLENLKLAISGEASRLTRGNSSFTSFSGGTRTPHYMKDLSVFMSTTNLTEGVFSVAVELQNNIEWTPYETVNKALNIGNTHNVNTTMYPSKFTLNKRTLSGSISQYVTSDFNSDLLQWKKGVNILIKAGTASGSFKGFKFDLSQCTFTNRITPAEVYAQTYDWRMNDNPADLGTKITLT